MTTGVEKVIRNDRGDVILPNKETLTKENLPFYRILAYADEGEFLFGKKKDVVAHFARTTPYDIRCAIVEEMAEQDACLSDRGGCPELMKFFEKISEVAGNRESLDSHYEYLMGLAKKLEEPALENFLNFAKVMLAKDLVWNEGWLRSETGEYLIRKEVGITKALESFAEGATRGVIEIGPEKVVKEVFVPFVGRVVTRLPASDSEKVAELTKESHSQAAEVEKFGAGWAMLCACRSASAVVEAIEQSVKNAAILRDSRFQILRLAYEAREEEEGRQKKDLEELVNMAVRKSQAELLEEKLRDNLTSPNRPRSV